MKIYKNRIKSLCEWMQKQKIDAVVIEDTEGRQTKNLRYLSGMDSDALLIVFSNSETVLVAWDVIMAEKTAFADKIISYGDFNRNFCKAVKQICSAKLTEGTIEFSSSTPYVLYNELEKELYPFTIKCRAEGVDEYLLNLRAVKDEVEIEIYKEAGLLTNKLINTIEAAFIDGSIKTEIDAAMLIESEGRKLGAEGTSFETLAAGAGRSWGIHCIPAYSSDNIGTVLQGQAGGLSIIDCGLKFKGYATDITMTICRGSLSDKQEQMVELTKKAHNLAAEKASHKNICANELATAVDKFFEETGYIMPHSLGHGIGLDVHEAPSIKSGTPFKKTILPGMIFTIEPGLYDKDAGGVRLENDYLMTESGAVPITASKIIYLP